MNKLPYSARSKVERIEAAASGFTFESNCQKDFRSRREHLVNGYNPQTIYPRPLDYELPGNLA